MTFALFKESPLAQERNGIIARSHGRVAMDRNETMRQKPYRVKCDGAQQCGARWREESGTIGYVHAGEGCYRQINILTRTRHGHDV
jgi:hypothetical protein